MDAFKQEDVLLVPVLHEVVLSLEQAEVVEAVMGHLLISLHKDKIGLVVEQISILETRMILLKGILTECVEFGQHLLDLIGKVEYSVLVLVNTSNNQILGQDSNIFPSTQGQLQVAEDCNLDEIKGHIEEIFHWEGSDVVPHNPWITSLQVGVDDDLEVHYIFFKFQLLADVSSTH